MAEPWPALVTASMLGAILAGGAMCWLARTTGTRHLVRRVEDLQDVIAHWQSTHRARFSGLELRLTGIEVAVGSAEEEAHLASLTMAQIQGDLLRRLEELEQHCELRVLVDQGRIPQEHLSDQP